MESLFRDIALGGQSVHFPLAEHKQALLGEIVGFNEGMRHLDLVCGSGELLTAWAQTYGIIGVGVDSSEVLIEAALWRAHEREVPDQVNFVVEDPAQYPQPFHVFDCVSCLSASTISPRMMDTLHLIMTAITTDPPGGTLLIGEHYWRQEPPESVCTALNVTADSYHNLGSTLDTIESIGLELVEMVLSSEEEHDRYESQQWRAVDNWLRENTDHTQAESLYTWISKRRQRYLRYTRDYLGWGVFVLRP